MNITQRITYCTAAMGCLAILSGARPAATAEPGKAVLAYYENDNGASSSALHDRRTYFNQVAADTFNIGAKGNVSGTDFGRDMNLRPLKNSLLPRVLSR